MNLSQKIWGKIVKNHKFCQQSCSFDNFVDITKEKVSPMLIINETFPQFLFWPSLGNYQAKFTIVTIGESMEINLSDLAPF